MKIVGEIKLFSYDQDFYELLDDGTIRPFGRTTIEELPKVLALHYGAKDYDGLVLIGPKQFTNNVADKIKTLLSTEYAVNDVNIEFIEKGANV